MSVRRQSARLAAIAIFVAAVATITACSDATSPTPPRPTSVIPGVAPQHELNPADTLDCRSGWVITQGRYQCV